MYLSKTPLEVHVGLCGCFQYDVLLVDSAGLMMKLATHRLRSVEVRCAFYIRCTKQPACPAVYRLLRCKSEASRLATCSGLPTYLSGLVAIADSVRRLQTKAVVVQCHTVIVHSTGAPLGSPTGSLLKLVKNESEPFCKGSQSSQVASHVV